MVETVPGSIKNFIKMYLYGTVTLPENVEDRLRDVPKDYTFDVKVGHTEYMNSVGRYAHASQASIVAEFFNGNLDSSSAVSRADGSKSTTIGEYLAAHPESNLRSTFEVSQYFTDPSSEDFAERAFIWGTTYFRVNDDARLVWHNGVVSIEGLEVSADRLRGPSNDDFDFIAGNPVIQLINDQLLEPEIDPYGIGRRIAIDFTDSPGRQYLQYTGDDYYADVSAASAEQYSVDVAAYYDAAQQFLFQTQYGEVVPYYDYDRFIVYGSLNDDIITENSVAYSFFSPGYMGITVAAGGGSDNITGTTFSDIFYGGAGNDLMYSLGGDDILYGRDDDDTIYAGDGDDLIDGGTGADIIDGGAGYDTIDFSSKATQGLNVKVHGGDLGGGNHSLRFDVISGLADPSGDYVEKVERITGTGFDDRIDATDAFVDIDGGAGNDWIKASLELTSDGSDESFQSFPGDPGKGTTVDGGAGDDTIIGGFIVNGGSGNDTLDMRSWIAKSPSAQWGGGMATVVVTGEFGHDRILSDHDFVDERMFSYGSANSTGISHVNFTGFSKDEFSFIYDVKSYKTGSEIYFNALGNLAIVRDATGESLLIEDFKMLLGRYDDGHYEVMERGWDEITWNSLGDFVFDDGIAAVDVVQFGSTAQFEAFWGV